MRRGTIFALLICCGWTGVYAEEQRSLNDAFSNPGVRKLAEAACAGDARAMADALKKGAGPDEPGPWNDTPLTWAVSCGNLNGVEVLLAAGADPSFRAPNKMLTHEDAERLKIWPPEPEPIDGFSAVYVAAGIADSNILSLLLRKGGDPNSYRGEDTNSSCLQRALSLGVHQGNWANYYLLLKAGADINRANSAGATIVDWAVALGAMDKVEELLNRGYKHDLAHLLRAVEGRRIVNPDQAAARDRIVRRLEDKGVVVR
jgi:ankyrin repeat protein